MEAFCKLHKLICHHHEVNLRAKVLSLTVIEPAPVLADWEAEGARAHHACTRAHRQPEVSAAFAVSDRDQLPWMPLRLRTSVRYHAANCPGVRRCAYEAAGPRQPPLTLCTDSGFIGCGCSLSQVSVCGSHTSSLRVHNFIMEWYTWYGAQPRGHPVVSMHAQALPAGSGACLQDVHERPAQGHIQVLRH